jgi:hypothetical protein
VITLRSWALDAHRFGDLEGDPGQRVRRNGTPLPRHELPTSATGWRIVIASTSVAAEPVRISCLPVAGSMPLKIRTWKPCTALTDTGQTGCWALPGRPCRDGNHPELDSPWDS